MLSKTLYWASTALVAVGAMLSGVLYLTNPDMRAAFTHLGFGDAFRIELGVAKIIGGLVLLAPLPIRLKEWAYAGFAITFVSAFIAHSAAGDALAQRIPPLFFLALLALSYLLFSKRQRILAA